MFIVCKYRSRVTPPNNIITFLLAPCYCNFEYLNKTLFCQLLASMLEPYTYRILTKYIQWFCSVCASNCLNVFHTSFKYAWEVYNSQLTLLYIILFHFNTCFQFQLKPTGQWLINTSFIIVKLCKHFFTSRLFIVTRFTPYKCHNNIID